LTCAREQPADAGDVGHDAVEDPAHLQVRGWFAAGKGFEQVAESDL
jgi:hypothetical protein